MRRYLKPSLTVVVNVAIAVLGTYQVTQDLYAAGLAGLAVIQGLLQSRPKLDK